MVEGGTIYKPALPIFGAGKWAGPPPEKRELHHLIREILVVSSYFTPYLPIFELLGQSRLDTLHQNASSFSKSFDMLWPLLTIFRTLSRNVIGTLLKPISNWKIDNDAWPSNTSDKQVLVSELKCQIFFLIKNIIWNLIGLLQNQPELLYVLRWIVHQIDFKSHWNSRCSFTSFEMAFAIDARKWQWFFPISWGALEIDVSLICQSSFRNMDSELYFSD